MRKKRTPPDQQGDILRALESTLGETSGPVAIGLDMAAQQGNWGLAVLALTTDLRQAKLCTVLPQPKINADWSRSPTLLFRPSLPLVENVLCLVRQAGRGGSLAVDTPFGWPCEQKRFLDGWSAAEGWKFLSRAQAEQMPSPERFARRLCDLHLAEMYPAVQPFAVGADKIALASVAWAVARTTLAPHLGSVDFGLEDRPTGFATFETYPGAFVKLVAHEYGDYKGEPEVRARLLEKLCDEYEIDRTEAEEEVLIWACNQGGSPNAFDALLCALSAWDHIRWRVQPTSFGLSTPEHLLRRLPSQSEIRQISQEGWILVRTEAHVPLGEGREL